MLVVCDYRPQKDAPHRVRWTVGGDKVNYSGVVATPTTVDVFRKFVSAKLIEKSLFYCFEFDTLRFGKLVNATVHGRSSQRHEKNQKSKSSRMVFFLDRGTKIKGT